MLDGWLRGGPFGRRSSYLGRCQNDGFALASQMTSEQLGLLRKHTDQQACNESESNQQKQTTESANDSSRAKATSA
jgi:hypothetical protein